MLLKPQRIEAMRGSALVRFVSIIFQPVEGVCAAGQVYPSTNWPLFSPTGDILFPILEHDLQPASPVARPPVRAHRSPKTPQVRRRKTTGPLSIGGPVARFTRPVQHLQPEKPVVIERETPSPPMQLLMSMERRRARRSRLGKNHTFANSGCQQPGDTDREKFSVPPSDEEECASGPDSA